MLMRTARKGSPISPTIFQVCQCQLSLVSASSFAVCCISSVGGGGFKAASHKSPDILILTRWSPVRRGFPLVLWVGVIVLQLLVSLWSKWERIIAFWSPAVLQDQWQRREMLNGDAGLCWWSCVGEHLAAWPAVPVLGNHQSKLKKAKRWPAVLLERRFNGTKEIGMQGKQVVIKHMPLLPPNV